MYAFKFCFFTSSCNIQVCFLELVRSHCVHILICDNWCRVLILGATLAAAKTTSRTAQHIKEILRNRLEVCYILLYIYAQITWVVVEGYANFICDNTVYVNYRNVLSPPLPKKTLGSLLFLQKKIVSYFILVDVKFWAIFLSTFVLP